MNKSTKKDHTPLTKEQGKVLIKACDYIIKNKESCQSRLFMRDFAVFKGKSIRPGHKNYHNCGTSCCFLGHFPMAGIKAKQNEDWWAYLRRVMGDDHFDETDAYDWLFDPGWPDDIDFCLKRAAYALKFGVPFHDGRYTSDFDCHVKPAERIRPNWNKLKEMYEYKD